MTTSADTIPGYTYGSVPPSPVTRADLDLLLDTLLWTDDDKAALRLAGEVLADQIDDVLDLWYGYVGSKPHLVASFAGRDGQPDANYLAAVRARFGQWIRDLTTREFDETWLAYQEEIGRRHHESAKGRTDGVESPATYVPLRYMVAFIWPITATIRDFLAKKGHSPADVDRMHQAWFKAVTLSTVLWVRPYNERLW
jgi:hypothetical protein